MSETDDLIDDFDDEDEAELDNPIEIQEVAKKQLNKRKVDLRRLIEARNDLAMLADEQHYFMKLDLESDSPLI